MHWTRSSKRIVRGHGDSKSWQAALPYANERNCGNRQSLARRHCLRSYHFVIVVWRAKEAQSDRVKGREINSE